MKNEVLLLGDTGLLGSHFLKFLQRRRDIQYRSISRNGPDINVDLTQTELVEKLLYKLRPKYIINCAADLSVNNGLSSLSSWQMNVKLVNDLIAFCTIMDSKLLHFSTDQYYPYGNGDLHCEEDKVFIRSDYALQKYCAERVALLSPTSLIVRTSFIGRGHNNLLDWILAELRNSSLSQIYNDAWTSSMHVDDLVNLSSRLFFDCEAVGVYNLGLNTSYTKAELFIALAEKLNVIPSNYILAELAKIHPTKPRCLGLDCTKAEKALNCRMPNLDQTLSKIVEEVCNEFKENM